MKNIKFKLLIMFMLLVLVGLGSSSVLGKEVEVLKVSDLYKLQAASNGVDKVYIITSNGNVESDKNLGYVSSYNYRQNMVLDKTFVVNGVEYIRYSDWIDGYFNNIYGRTDIYTYSKFDLYEIFGEAYYKHMSAITYKKLLSFKEYTYEQVVEQVDSELHKKITNVSSPSEKGYFIMQDFFKANPNLTIEEFIGKGSDKVEELLSKLYYAYMDASKVIMINRSEEDAFCELWGNSDASYNVELKNKYLNYYMSKKTSIDESLIPSTTPTPTPEPEKNPQDYEEGINNFWQNAFDWFKGAQASGGMGTVTDGFMKGATNIIKMVGNMIFIVVTSILGVKYIWGSADAKYSVKNSLFSLVIAAVVFYGWDSISNIIQTVTTSTVGNNIESTTRTIYTYILYFVNIAAIGGIIFLGVKYLLASAEGKSQLKMNMGPAFLGIIMVYATISFLNTILSIFLG